MKKVSYDEFTSHIKTIEDYNRLYWFSTDRGCVWLDGFTEVAGERVLPRIVECSWWLNDKGITTVSGAVESLNSENRTTYLVDYEDYESACAGIIWNFLPDKEVVERSDDWVLVVCRDDELPEIIKRYADGTYNIWVYVED